MSTRIRVRLSAGVHQIWVTYRRRRDGSWVSANGRRRFEDDVEFWRFVGGREVVSP